MQCICKDLARLPRAPITDDLGSTRGRLQVPKKLIEVSKARRLVSERVGPPTAEPVPLRSALGRVLAADIASSDAVPGFDNSSMDGFAVRAADTKGAGAGAPVALRVAGESRAGRPARSALDEGQAIAISTGAVVPGGRRRRRPGRGHQHARRAGGGLRLSRARQQRASRRRRHPAWRDRAAPGHDDRSRRAGRARVGRGRRGQLRPPPPHLGADDRGRTARAR